MPSEQNNTTMNPAHEQRSVVCIGLDSTDADLVFEWAQRGLLPNFARLIETGVVADIAGLDGYGSGAVWPSFATGAPPSAHGRFYYQAFERGSYEAHNVGARQLDLPALWDVLEQQGCSTVVVDFPQAQISERSDATMVVDWIRHDGHRATTSNPPELARRLQLDYGRDLLGGRCDRAAKGTADEITAFVETLVTRTRSKADHAIDCLGSHDRPRLLATVFGESHCVGHQLWHIHDPSHPAHDPEIAASIGDPILTLYRAVDEQIARIESAMGPDDVLMVLLGTGMGPNFSGNALLDEALRRIERPPKSARAGLWRTAKSVLKQVVPLRIRERLRSTKRRVEEAAFAHERAGRDSFAIPHNDCAGAIRVNLEGREASGRVAPGDELDAHFERTRSALLEIRNLDTGEPAIEDVVRTSDRESGRYIENMPDYFVLWNRSRPLERIGSGRIGEVTYPLRGNRTGDHTYRHALFVSGVDLEPGVIADMSIEDFAPTLTALLGCDMPTSHGRPRLDPARLTPLVG